MEEEGKQDCEGLVIIAVQIHYRDADTNMFRICCRICNSPRFTALHGESVRQWRSNSGLPSHMWLFLPALTIIISLTLPSDSGAGPSCADMVGKVLVDAISCFLSR